jgi:ABC-type branched-subunit amino acid transport system permease subunit
MVILSIVAFGLGAWWTFVGTISVGDGVFMLCGWCVSAVIFSYRALDPDYLDAISIIKSR